MAKKSTPSSRAPRRGSPSERPTRAWSADVAAKLRPAKKKLKPPPKLSLSEWADEYFYLSAESAAEPGRWRTLAYQRGIMDAITDPRVKRVSVQKSARIGYALAIDTPIPTPSGWATMSALAVGDRVFDEAGRVCRVRTKSQIFTDHTCYRIRFCDGSEVVADADHRWFVESDVSLEHLAAGKRGRTGRPRAGDTKTFSGVIDTATMARAMLTSRGRTALAIPNARPLDLPDVDLPVPPYTLGLWLGDGNASTPRITQHRPDADEVADCIRGEGIAASVRYIDERYPNNATVFLDVPNMGRPVSPWAKKLRAIGVLDDKHVPPVYLRSSIAQRIALLRGLMDSDGTAGKDGRAEFVNTNEQLARSVYELVVSLGMKATLNRRAPQREGYKPQWRVNFRPTPDMNPFGLRRKADRVQPAPRPTITLRRRVIAVDEVPSVPTQCIEVDSPTHLFLAGRQMVPTHNTKMLNAAIGYYVHQDPCPIMVVQPTVDDAEGYSKEEIAPMVRDCEVLTDLIGAAPPRRGRPKKGAKHRESSTKTSSETILLKKFPGGVLEVVGANSGRGFRRRSRRVVFFDEVDGYPASAGNEGDPVKLGERRAEYYWNRKFVAGSTPLIAGASRIEELFNEGDRRRYYVPCPHCGHMDYLRFNPGGDELERGHYMLWPKGPEDAHFVCGSPSCRKRIDESSKRAMIEAGEWRAEGEFAGHASFSLWAAYSLSPNATWRQIVEEYIEAKNDPLKHKTFVNTVLGETYQERGEAPEWERLFNRRELYAIGTVPDGVIIITAGVDVQKDRFYYEVVGWGARKESWSIDAGEIEGDTALESTWQKLDDELLARAFVASGGAVHTISMLAVDSGYNTQMAYSWARGKPRVMTTKGVAGRKELLGSPTKVDVKVNGKKKARGHRLWPVGVDTAKSELYGWLQLEVAEDGSVPAGFCHFSAGHREWYFQQLTSEQMVTITSKRTRRQKREWHVLPGRENHILDCRNYARAAAVRIKVDRLPRDAGAREVKPTAPTPAAAPAPAPALVTPAPPPISPPTAPEPQRETGRPAGFWNRPRGVGWFGRRR